MRTPLELGAWRLRDLLYLRRSLAHFRRHGQPLDFPFKVQLQTQSRCQARCPICPYPARARELPHGAMEDALLERLLHELAAAPLLDELVFMLQNEPLLDRRLFERIGAFKRLAPAKRCSLATSGELLDRFSPDELAASGVDELLVSVNAASPATFAALTGGLSFERVCAGVERLLADPRLRARVVVGFVLTEASRRELPAALWRWTRAGARVRVTQLSNRGGDLEGFERLRPSTAPGGLAGRLAADLHRRAARRLLGPCPFPFYALSVLHDGAVLLCCHDWRRALLVGDARAQSLREIWLGPELQRARRALVDDRRQELPGCVACSTRA